MTEQSLAHIGMNGELHDLKDHLTSVADLAARHSKGFDASGCAELAGLWHDLGKYRAGFQKYIRQTRDPDAHIEGRVSGRDKTHSAAGALWAQQYLADRMGPYGQVAGRVLSYLIAGHHAGLDNWFQGLNERLAGENARCEFDDALSGQVSSCILKPELSDPDMGEIPVDGKEGRPPGAFALWVRMLFSSLVDADFLDTERFLNPEKFEGRQGYPEIAQLLVMFDDFMQRKLADTKRAGSDNSPVNQLRADVLFHCRQKAQLHSGVFTLTVPTGGGKTLSSLAFALNHAVAHQKRRIIYAIPYTSIIEQTADIFRSIFGDSNIVEHHSNVESDERKETQRSRLACENWDAPVIVTTNVQLFESLFARKTSRCRKLHNLVNSVIVLDEAQLLPVEFLQPILDVLGILVRDYGVTLVLCTATQPALTRRDSFDPSLQIRGFLAHEVTEIIDDVPALYAALKRVRVYKPKDFSHRQSWDDISHAVLEHQAVLTIVNRRKDAAELYRLLHSANGQGLFHLSALMCAQHRSDAIRKIKLALDGFRVGQVQQVRVVSTQLVEAGVDLDFPVVFRAMAGLDSIAQAAGRCNREGQLEEGQVHVFMPPSLPPPGLLRHAAAECQTAWAVLDAEADPIAVELYKPYFQRLYARNLDERDICKALRVGQEGDVRFKDAAEAFKLIDDKDGAVVLVRYQSDNTNENVDTLIGKLEAEGPQRWLLRKLQRYGVTLYKHDAERLLTTGDLRFVDGCPGLYVQHSTLLYHPELGLVADGAPGDPAMLVG